MKLSLGVVVLIFVVLLIIMCSTCAGSYVPYQADPVFSIQYPYESEAFTAMKSGLDAVVSAVSGEKKESKKDGCKKVEGFGLMPAPYGVEAPIDRFSALKSSKTCAGSPYSTSTGYVCLDKEAEKLLSTRGGNMSGGDSQIA